jgi:hypothetical protein
VLPDFVVHKRKTGWRAPAEDWYFRGSKMTQFVRAHLDAGFYPPTASLFDFKGILREGNRHSLFLVLHFQTWAQQFGITV